MTLSEHLAGICSVGKGSLVSLVDFAGGLLIVSVVLIWGNAL
jgi:hypothetical protein